MSARLGAWAQVAKPFRYAAVVTAAAVLVGGWLYLYVKARAVDLGAANEVMAGLRELKEIDGRWTDWLIGTRLDTGAEGAAAVPRSSVEPTTLARIHALLAVRVFALGNALPPSTLARLKETFDAKAKAVDAFATASDSSRQAIAGYLRAADAFAAAAGERASGIPPAVAREADRVRETMLVFVAQPGAAAAKTAESAVAQLAAAEVPEHARMEIDRLAGAARKAIEARAGEDARFRDAVFASTGPRLDAAMRAFERGFGDALDEADRFRMYLVVYSGFLLLLAAWLAWRLTANYRVISKLNRQLREANEFLEHRVEERTRELKAALQQLREQEALLIQSEKMSSLGQMVAGVAHEVNTPLAYVKASLDTVHGRMPKVAAALGEAERLIQMLQSEQADDAQLSRQFAVASSALREAHSGGAFPELDTLVQDGMYGIGQISELVNNLRNFARLDRSRIAEFDLNEGLASAISIAKHQLKKRTVNKLLGAIPKISCAPSQINQVFLNLLTNAAQATPEEGGVINLRTFQPDPSRVVVEVMDNGHGIPADVLPKIFDPFFTTKEVGKGTGLGLSICYKIIDAHGGRIDVDSKIGVGTRFTVTLPVKPVVVDKELAAV
jgi:two-component system NtrC family sensor kinase